MSREALLTALHGAAAGWQAGDAVAVAEVFAEELEYVDPYGYRFTRRAELLPFFEPPPGGHRVVWHTVIWDDTNATGAVEYTYEGHHRYHGTSIVRLDGDGRIVLWREWQHRDDDLDWETRLQGPAGHDPTLAAIDHVQLGMPAGVEALAEARSFYVDLLRMREVTKPPQLAGRGGAWFASGGVAVHLGVEPDFRPSPRAHPAFAVDLAALRVRLLAADVPVEDDDSGLPIARCYVRDPFGNRIELVDLADAGFSLA